MRFLHQVSATVLLLLLHAVVVRASTVWNSVAAAAVVVRASSVYKSVDVAAAVVVLASTVCKSVAVAAAVVVLASTVSKRVAVAASAEVAVAVKIWLTMCGGVGTSGSRKVVSEHVLFSCFILFVLIPRT